MTQASRPTQLPRWFLACALALLGMSFVSGVLAWWGQASNAALDPALDAADARFPVLFWLTLHGFLNPLLCVVYGYLLRHHVPLGWRMRANRQTGAGMVLVFGGLIVSGVGLYYAGGEGARDFWVAIHRVLGLLLPALVAAHWIGAVRWARGRGQLGGNPL